MNIDDITIFDAKVIVNDDWVYLISDNPNIRAINQNSNGNWSVISEDIFNKVVIFIKQPKIEQLLKAMFIEDPEGNIPYWEIDYRDKLIRFISNEHSEIGNEGDISNSLHALGL